MAKSEIKTKPTKASVKDYLDAIKDPFRKKDCKEIVKMMKAVTGKNPVMWGASLVGFGKVRQVYSTGREVDWIVMGLASRKDSISLYLTCDLIQMEKELETLGAHKRGVGCLYIKKLEDVHMPTFKKLLRTSVKLAGKNTAK